MKKRQTFEMAEIVQEIGMLIEDWNFAKCPHGTGPKYIQCKGCPHSKLCKCLVVLSTIKMSMYDINGDLK